MLLADKHQDTGFRAVFGTRRFDLGPDPVRDRIASPREKNLRLLLDMLRREGRATNTSILDIRQEDTLIAGISDPMIGTWISGSFRSWEGLNASGLHAASNPTFNRPPKPTFVFDLEENEPRLLLLRWPTLQELQEGTLPIIEDGGVRLSRELTIRSISAAHIG